jgi:phosphoribosylaminoimidazolecarboxamide formyltransferase/IMP cyclohydrolase
MGPGVLGASVNEPPQRIEVLRIRRALLAVSDKAGLMSLGKALVGRGVELVSTGNSADVLRSAGLPVTTVADVTGSPEMLGGRVKTLHPRIHAGILADKRRAEHLRQLEEHAIEPFDLVVVNLYPFVETAWAGASPDEVIEQIDIGGPAMVRAAAKNFESVGVVVKPDDYQSVLDELEEHDGLTRPTRLTLARRAFAHVAAYDAAVAAWFAGRDSDEEQRLPGLMNVVLARSSELRYGENPHQRGGLYAPEGTPGPLGGAEVLQGKDMSFNNWLDAEAARATVALFDGPAAVIVKHSNPCGAAQRPTLAEAYRLALEGDPISAFGGIVAFNGEVDDETAGAMAGVFTEVVVAPGFTAEALEALAGRKNLRVLRAPPPDRGGHRVEVRPIDGGALVQDMDAVVEAPGDMKVVTTTEPSAGQWQDLLFAWKVAAMARSNAIVLARGLATVGVGAGQMNRLTSVDIAARNAGDRALGSCLASDAFFPFRDGIDRAAEAGVAAIIQPGGSVRDEEVMAAAEEHGMTMVFTGRRHFRH